MNPNDIFGDDTQSSNTDTARDAIFNMDDNTFQDEYYKAVNSPKDTLDMEVDNISEPEPIEGDESESEPEPLDNSVDDNSTPEPKEDDLDSLGEEEPHDESTKFTIKADGENYELTLEELQSLASKGINYTKKLQKVKPFRRMIGMLEENQISEEDLNQFIEMREGNRVALANFLAKKQIPLDDLESQSNEDISNYVAKQYGKEITPFTEKVEELKGRPNFEKLVSYVTSLDESSKRGIVANPEALDILMNDIDNGYFDEIYKEAEKKRLISSDNRSMLDYYVSAANSHFDKLSSRITKPNKVLTSKAPAKGNKDKVKMSGNVSSSKAGGFKVVNMIEEIDDEDFEAFMRSIGGR